MMIQKPFVLSGGGARGFAHVGVLKAMEEAGVYPAEIAATSAGSIIGAFVADGFSAEEIRELMLKKIGLSMLVQWDDFRSGFISLKNLGDFMRKNLRHRRLEDLPVPFYVAATNFIDGNQHIFKTGDIVDAVLAASSIPVLFLPMMINDTPFVDGGLSNNLPAEPFEGRKHEVIAVHVNAIPPFDEKSGMAQTLDRTLHLSFMHTVKKSAEGCLLYIEPPALHRFGIFDVHKLSEIYQTGYTYTTQILKDQIFIDP